MDDHRQKPEISSSFLCCPQGRWNVRQPLSFSIRTETGDVDINPPSVSRSQNIIAREFGLRKHTSAKEIRAFVGPDAFSSAFKFAFVRNPYARFFSLYNFSSSIVAEVGGRRNHGPVHALCRLCPFRFFACGTAEGAGRDSIYRLFGSQMFWLCEDGKRPLVGFCRQGRAARSRL